MFARHDGPLLAKLVVLKGRDLGSFELGPESHLSVQTHPRGHVEVGAERGATPVKRRVLSKAVRGGHGALRSLDLWKVNLPLLLQGDCVSILGFHLV